MFWGMFVALLLTWFAGVVTSNTLDGFIHILLIVAVAAGVVRLIQKRAVL